MLPRHRDTGVIPTQTITQYRQPVGGAQTVVTVSAGRYDAYLTSSMDGWDLPGFYARQRAGELLPFTEFTQFEADANGSGSFDFTNTTPNPDVRYWYAPNYCYGSYLIGAAELQAVINSQNIDYADLVQAAAANLYSSGFDGLTFLAELKKTIRMFTNIGKTLTDLLRKGNVQNTWLQYRYGWRILYFEMVELSRALESLSKESKRRSRMSRSISLSGGSTSSVAANLPECNRTVTTVITWTLSARGSIIADFEPPAFSFNPIVTAWEVIPFSFIIDWFFKVGQLLSSMSFVAFNSGYQAGVGHKLTYSKRIYFSSVTANAGWTKNAASSDWTVNAKLTKRTPSSVPFRLSTSFRVPEALKILDLLALVAQRVRR